MTLPLFERFPGTAHLPVAGIAALPTPLDPHPGIAASHGIAELAVKRDDLTSELYGGNKVRKLDFLLGQALAEERRSVITFGAYGSNHALATAVHARALGLETHAVLSPQEPGPYARATLLAHAALGTHLHLVDGWDGAREAVRVKHELAARDGIEPLVIPMGGTSSLGAVGYVNAAFELESQCRRTGTATADTPCLPDLIYVAGGTLGTAVGLAIGLAALRASTEVVAVRVTPDQVANEAFAQRIATETVQLLRSLDPDFPALEFDDLAFELDHGHFEPGYGVVTPQVRAAVDAAAAEGVRLETTYTGKAAVAMFAHARDGLLAHERVVFWNTYNSAPMPEAGPASVLPVALQHYIAECERLFAGASTEGGGGEGS